MKTTINAILFGLLVSVMFSACGSLNTYRQRTIKVQGTPDADIYLKGNWSFSMNDGFNKIKRSTSSICENKETYQYIGSTDSVGQCVFQITGDDFRRSKRKILIMKSGYEATNFKLKKRFNPYALIDFCWTPLLIFERNFTIPSHKRTNMVQLSKQSELSCFDYYDKALNARKDKDKIKYFQKTMEQDYRNERGMKAQALNDIGIIYTKKDKHHLAYLYFKMSSEAEPGGDADSNLEWLTGIVKRQEEIARQKQIRSDERFDRTLAVLDGINTGLQVATTVYGATSSSSYSSDNAGSGSTQSSQTSKSNNSAPTSSKSPSGNDAVYKNSDSRVYSDWETQLIKMEVYYERDYSDSNRRYIQEQMVQIRRKWEDRGFKMYKSEWETWDGRKK